MEYNSHTRTEAVVCLVVVQASRTEHRRASLLSRGFARAEHFQRGPLGLDVQDRRLDGHPGYVAC